MLFCVKQLCRNGGSYGVKDNLYTRRRDWPGDRGGGKKILNAVAAKFGHDMQYTDILMGGASIDVHGVPLTDEAVETARSADAVLMGSIGGDTTTSPWYKLAPNLRPEAGLLAIRKALNLFANCVRRYCMRSWREPVL